MDSNKAYLKKVIGVSKESFKYFGGSFIYYKDFCDYQHKKIDELSENEVELLIKYIYAIKTFGVRHIDFYTPTEQLVVDGLYFHENGKLITYSDP